MVKRYLVSSSRKKARARASVCSGKGIIKVNNKPVDVFVTGYKYEYLKEPKDLIGDSFNKYNYNVTVSGGGIIGQVTAVRSVLAKGYYKASGEKKTIRDKIVSYDRNLLVDDVRNKEPKKQLGRGARKKKQSSKR